MLEAVTLFAAPRRSRSEPSQRGDDEPQPEAGRDRQEQGSAESYERVI
jgi:hypothetical protein